MSTEVPDRQQVVMELAEVEAIRTEEELVRQELPTHTEQVVQLVLHPEEVEAEQDSRLSIRSKSTLTSYNRE